MSKVQLMAVLGLTSIAPFLASTAVAHPPSGGGPRVSVGIGIGVPVAPYYRPYPYYYPYYRPYPYYYPPPVVVAPPPVVYQQPAVIVAQPAQTVVQPAPGIVQQAPSQPAYSQPTVAASPASNVDGYLANLRSQEENVRRDSVLELGRMKAVTAVQPLTATLAGDQSPAVREAAARALGMIGSPQALTALTYAAQSDGDRDVRHSAAFAVDVIRANNR